MLPNLPDKRDVSGMLYASQQALARLATMQMRIFARLTRVAEAVESQLGLDAIADVDAEETKTGTRSRK